MTSQPPTSVPIRDFSRRKSFPGTIGGPFEILVRSGVWIERIPPTAYAVVLLLLSLIPSGGQWGPALSLWLIFLFDWIILALLPRFRISYGHPQPQSLALALMRIPAALLPGVWAPAVQGLGTALVVYGFGLEPTWLEVTHEQLTSERLGLRRPIRIVHFGDLHMHRPCRLDDQVVAEISRLRPDLILFSGDAISYSCVDDPEAWMAARRVFQRLDASLGVYAVPGSPPVDRPDVLSEVFEGTPVRLLNDERITIRAHGGEIELIGVACSHRPFLDAKTLEQLVSESSGGFRLLLYHSPDLAPHAATIGIDLQFSGHTHGGQVRLPVLGAIYTSSLYGKAMEVGRMKVGGMTLFVTRGLGMEGASAPRVRFLCRPQITLWELA